MSYYRRKFADKVIRHRSRLRRFLTKLDRHPPLGLDLYATEIEKEVWKEVDCLVCSNCCRTMTPTFTYRDQQRISAHFNMTIREFREKWLFKNREGDWMNVQEPCQFLDRRTNLCTIYEIRPADCAEFPHLNKRKVTSYLHIHRQNVQHCPATFKMVEKLMAALATPGHWPEQQEPYK